MIGLLDGHDGRVGRQGKVYSGIGHEIRLELGEIDVEGAVESQRRRDRGDDLADQTIQIRVRRPLDVEIASANVVDRLVVHEERAVRVIERGVRRQYGVVRLDNGRGDLRRRIDGEFQLRFLPVIVGQLVHQQTRESGSGSAAERVKYQETLQTAAHVGYLANSVQHQVDDLFAEGVVTARVIVRCILLAGDQLLGVEQLMVRSRAYFIYVRT